jgi:cell division septation protein DedD
LPRAAELEPSIRLPPLEELRPEPVRAWSDFESSAVESESTSWEAEAASEAAAAKPSGSEPGPRETSQTRGSRRSYDLPDAEFAFDEEAKFSRWPLVVVIVLLVTIVFFVGSILWLRSRPGGSPEKRVETPLAGATPDSPSGNAAGPDDSRAAEEGGASPPAATQAPPAPAGPAPVVTPPNPPDDRAAATEPDPGRGNAPSGPEEQRDKSPGPPAGSSTPLPAASVPPPAPAPAPSAPPAVGEISYAVHVSSYQTVNKANVEIANLRKLGYEARAVRENLGDKGWWYRVYAGSFATREEAAAAREVLLKHPDYNYAQVRRLPRP